MDDVFDDDVAPPRALVSPSRWRLLAAFTVAGLALLTAFVDSSTLSLVAYLTALVAGAGLLAWHRYVDGKASWDVNYVPSRLLRRLAAGTAVLIVAACAANAFVWATEVSKL